MTASPAKSTSCLGFLTVVENSELGLLGGYLLLNAAGRPLEFHCTTPVKPNRTQEILFGPTLRPFLYGEQIGQALLARSKLTPLAVCTDAEPVLAARDFTPIPLVLVLGEHAHDSPQSSAGGPFVLARNRVTTAAHYRSDEQAIRDSWPPTADHFDLLEPFTRIREALDEAQRVARQAA